MSALPFQLFSLFLFSFSACAANFYVRPSSAGSANGTDWSNAWSMTGLNSGWGSVAAGDTVWIAGGTYTTQMLPTANGTAANPIRIYRPRTTDAVPTAATGWSSGFDAQIILAPVNLEGIYYGTADQGHNMIFDGRITDGWKIVKDNGAAGTYPGCIQYDDNANSTNVIYANMDLVGPFDVTTPVLSGINNYHSCISLTPHTTPLGIRWMTFTNVSVHGGVTLVNVLGGWGTTNLGGQYITFDHCRFYNNMASQSEYHANMFELRDMGNITWRYCEFYQWLVEGIMPYGIQAGPLYIYGCWFHDPDNSEEVSRVIEPFETTQVFFYNNVFENCNSVGIYSSAGGGAWAVGSLSRNNIYWNSGDGGLGPPNPNYEFWGPLGSIAGANSIASASDPFVSVATGNYHILATVSAAYPRNKGVTLTDIGTHTFSRDADGNTRGADGTWDIGAYEYDSGAIAVQNRLRKAPARRR